MRPPERAQDRVLEPLSPLPGQSSSPEITRFGISPSAAKRDAPYRSRPGEEAKRLNSDGATAPTGHPSPPISHVSEAFPQSGRLESAPSVKTANKRPQGGERRAARNAADPRTVNCELIWP
jgi:hypothetical protein